MIKTNNDFSESEMKVRYTVPGARGRIDLPIYDAPITVRENMKKAIFNKEPLFMPNYRYYQNFTPRIVPDNEARGFVMDGGPPIAHPEGFKDMFGVNWIYVDIAGGSMVEPGSPMLSSMSEWKEKLLWPDIKHWDWNGQLELSKDFINNPELALVPTIMSGYFERLISLLDFEGAAIALIDEEQKKDVIEFLDKIADLYCSMIDKYVELFHIDGICVHDDWGSQRAPFFSLDAAMGMLVPHIRKVSDHAHSKGLFYDMHCCGQVENLIPAMIAAGVDSWTGQDMNDKPNLYHRYGRDIMIGVDTPEITKDMAPEKIIELARQYVDEFLCPGAPAMVGYNSQIQNPLFFEEVYRYSRKKYQMK